jgi:hypothetical protein
MEDATVIDDSLKKEIFRLNRIDSLCGKYELKWRVKGWKVNLVNVIKLFFG